MIKALTTFLMILMVVYIPVRPPEPPVSFAYDPNQVNYEIIEAIRTYPNEDITFTRTIIDDNNSPSLIFSDPTIIQSAPQITIDPNNDPNGPVYKIYKYACVFPVNRPPGIYYIDVTAADNDPNEPMFDKRTMLIYLWPKNRPPVIR